MRVEGKQVFTSKKLQTVPVHSSLDSMDAIRAFAVDGPGKSLEPFSFQPKPLAEEQVEIAVSHCGICHSDLSMMDNDWGQTSYPLVPGHEVVGVVTEVGSAAKRVRVGEKVGLGWFSGSCMSCPECLSGDHNLCAGAEQTVVGRHGGFADRVRCHWSCAIALPDQLDPSLSGPLFCGGITVFNPLLQFGVRPTDRVGVIGIGGLGHLALQFLNKWGCEVLAFSSDESKTEELHQLGAHQVVNSRDPAEWKALERSLDFLLVTVNVPLDWDACLGMLSPRGRIHFVGAVLKPLDIAAFSLISAQRSVSGSPVGSPATISKMLEFCARHQIAPITETFPFSKINDAIERLRSGKARYRVVLENDFR